ncbi:hypothetical protein Bbelb_216570 [Branchiostoma belcheri]|nr:hypothetical protein Bbelb_216570 [Branchiostoma belcheri]
MLYLPHTNDEQLHCVCDRLTPAFAGFVAPNPLDLGSSFIFDLDRSVIALVTVCVVMALYIVAVFIGRNADLADKRKRQKLSKTKGNGYLSHHLWLSVVKFPSGHFTRVQRISCCLSLLMSFMIVNIMFYRGDRDLLSKVTIGDVELSLPFSLTSFIIGLESSLIALPINVFIVVLFRYSGTRQEASTSLHTSKPKNKSRYGVTLKDQHIGELVLPRYLPKVQTVRSEFNAEYTADPTAYIDRLKKDAVGNQWLTAAKFSIAMKEVSVHSDFKGLQSVVVDVTHNGVWELVPDLNTSVDEALKKVDTRYVIKKEGSKVTVNQRPYRPFPWWCRIVAWLLVAAIVVVSGSFTVLYGNEYGRTKSQSWLFAFLISFLTDVIILQPIKIILVIIFFKLITKERRRKKILHSYENYYVTEPASLREYANATNLPPMRHFEYRYV